MPCRPLGLYQRSQHIPAIRQNTTQARSFSIKAVAMLLEMEITAMESEVAHLLAMEIVVSSGGQIELNDG